MKTITCATCGATTEVEGRPNPLATRWFIRWRYDEPLHALCPDCRRETLKAAWKARQQNAVDGGSDIIAPLATQEQYDRQEWAWINRNVSGAEEI